VAKHHDMRVYRENEGKAPCILNLDTQWKQVIASCPGYFISAPPRRRVSSTHWIGGCVDFTASLDTLMKTKKFLACQELNPTHPSCRQVLC